MHEIDPLGDTVITLRNPGAPFALWDESSELLTDDEDPSDLGKNAETPPPGTERSTPKLSKKERNMRKRRLAAEASESNASPAPLEAETERTNGALDEEPEATTASNVDNEVPTSTANVETESRTNGHEDIEIQYLVSSRHLMLVSPWFRRRFTSDTFSESKPSALDGRYHFAASDWDEDALLILLNIIHIRTRKAEAAISLEMFAKIAVIVDYYELEDEQALDRDVESWVKNLKSNSIFPTTNCRDLVLWICVSRVFRLTEQFEQATAVAIRTSCGWIQDLGLPISEDVTLEIDRVRCYDIEKIITKLHQLAEHYGDAGYSCPDYPISHSFQCGVSMYGALMRYMKDWGYVNPRPVAPFAGMCFENICSTVVEIRTPKWWHPRPGELGLYSPRNFITHSCDLHGVVDELVRNTRAKIKGLKFKDEHVDGTP